MLRVSAILQKGVPKEYKNMDRWIKSLLGFPRRLFVRVSKPKTWHFAVEYRVWRNRDHRVAWCLRGTVLYCFISCSLFPPNRTVWGHGAVTGLRSEALKLVVVFLNNLKVPVVLQVTLIPERCVEGGVFSFCLYFFFFVFMSQKCCKRAHMSKINSSTRWHSSVC